MNGLLAVEIVLDDFCQVGENFLNIEVKPRVSLFNRMVLHILFEIECEVAFFWDLHQDLDRFRKLVH